MLEQSAINTVGRSDSDHHAGGLGEPLARIRAALRAPAPRVRLASDARARLHGGAEARTADPARAVAIARIALVARGVTDPGVVETGDDATARVGPEAAVGLGRALGAPFTLGVTASRHALGVD